MRTLTNKYTCCTGVLLALFLIQPSYLKDLVPAKRSAGYEASKAIAKPQNKTVQTRRKWVIDRLRSLPPAIYVWQLEACLKGGPSLLLADYEPMTNSKYDALAYQAKAAGVMLLVKTHDGQEPFGDADELLVACDAYRVPVMTWSFNRLENWQNEADQVVTPFTHSCVVGYIADAEDGVAYKSERLRLMLDRIKSYRDKYYPGKLLGYTTYPLVSLHPEIYYKKLTKWADFAQPQLYSHHMKREGPESVTALWSRMVGEWSAQRKDYVGFRAPQPIPLAPVGQAYEGISLADQKMFVELVLRSHQPNFAFYSWQNMTPAAWQLISRPQSRSHSTILAAAK